MDFLNFYLVPGVVLGAEYALGAIAITLVFSIMRHAHIAHGDMATFGAFSALALVAATGISPYAALPFAILTTAAIAVGADRLFYAHLRERPKIFTTMASLGVALMLRSLIQMIWGVETMRYSSGISRPTDLMGIQIRGSELAALAAVGLTILTLFLFLQKTRWGKAMRAMSSNRNLALLSGVDNRQVVILTWAIVGGLCAISGFFLGLTTELKSMMGWNVLLPMFAAAILGGVGRVEGAVVGGFIVGIAEELSVLVLPGEYKALSGFAILLVLLLLRPTGLFKGKIL